MASLIRYTSTIFPRTFARSIHLTAHNYGKDQRDKRIGHVPKSDKVEGEQGTYESSGASFALIDDDLMNTVIDGTKFKDIASLHIRCTKNNTKVTLRKPNANLFVRKSAGTEGFKNCRKGTTVAAQAAANRVLGFIKDYNVDKVRMVFQGLGPGRDAAYKVFEISGIKVVSLSDRTEAIEPWIRRPRKVRRV